MRRHRLSGFLRRLESSSHQWIAQNSAACLRISIGLVFLWFGALKIFPGLSPAEALAGKTIERLSAGLVPTTLGVPLLGLFEVALGTALILSLALRQVLVTLLAHMAGTGLPLLLFPEKVFGPDPLTLTFEGQYIVKNLVIISGTLVVAARELGERHQRKERRDAPSPALVQQEVRPI